MARPIDIDICIGALRRSNLADAVRAAARQALPAGFAARIIVVDRDAETTAMAEIEKLKAEINLPLRHIHVGHACPASARNAALTAARGAWVALLDERSRPEAGWLKALIGAAQSEKADVVFGPVRAGYPQDAPAWMIAGDFHSAEVYRANNVLLRRTGAAWASLRFDPGQSGEGEDVAFYFRALRKAGARFAEAPQAVVIEDQDFQQLSFSYLWRTRTRQGRALARVRAYDGANPVFELARSATSAAACFAAAGGMAGSQVGRNRWLLRAASHVGATQSLLGLEGPRA
ncbi:MAG: glycosyltransferase [Caulobacterales bacterium]